MYHQTRVELNLLTQPSTDHSSSTGCAINKTLWERRIRRRGCGLVVNAEE